MRTIVLILTFLAVPALAVAQQPVDLDTDAAPPQVELQQTTTQATAPADAIDIDDARTVPATAERNMDVDDTALQAGPESRSWWWLVGAIVVGGIILAVIL